MEGLSEIIDIKRDIMFRLRAATAPSHARLESTLDLLSPPLLQSRFQRLLKDFEAFHLTWEPAVSRHPQLASLMNGRSRLPHLRRDLAALGLPTRDSGDGQGFPCDGELADTFPGALGSIYVMEGSTLGGQIIARALKACDWAPAGGLTYFTPYGGETGLMWRALQTRLRTMSIEFKNGEVERGAVRTFEALRIHLSSKEPKALSNEILYRGFGHQGPICLAASNIGSEHDSDSART